jgi:hypothetical protein
VVNVTGTKQKAATRWSVTADCEMLLGLDDAGIAVPFRGTLLPYLWQSLRLAINKVIHGDDIQVGYFQDAIARGNSD